MAARASELGRGEIGEGGDLAERTRWLVSVRWFAVAGIGVAAGAGWITRFVQTPLPLFGVGVAVGLYNAHLWWRLGRLEGDVPLARRHRLIFQQLVVDMGAL